MRTSHRTKRPSLVAANARRTIAVGMLLTCAACSPTAPKDEQDGMSCVQRLALPRYPPIANSARVAVEGLAAAVHLAQDGSVESVKFSTGESRAVQLVFPAIEKSMRASKFAASCGGRTVPVMFDFRLDDGADEDGFDVQRVAFHYPNRFEISVSPPVINTRHPDVPANASP